VDVAYLAVLIAAVLLIAAGCGFVLYKLLQSR
jgi:hypothetical protein